MMLECINPARLKRAGVIGKRARAITKPHPGARNIKALDLSPNPQTGGNSEGI
jgi:hypothetical protein